MFRTGADGRHWLCGVKPRYHPIPDDGPVGKLARAGVAAPFYDVEFDFVLSREA